MLRPPNVAILASDSDEISVLEQILSPYVRPIVARTLAELNSVLEENDCDAVFCAQSFQTGSWKESLEELRKLTPDLPVIVLSSAVEEKAWMQAIEAGAFDVLIPPYEQGHMLAVLEQASASRYA